MLNYDIGNDYYLDANEILNSMRNGQPVPYLMELFSPYLEEMKNYLINEFKSKSQIKRIIVGEPGDGKTTFKDILVQDIHKIETIYGVVPVEFVLPYDSIFRTQNFFCSLFLNDSIFDMIAHKGFSFDETIYRGAKQHVFFDCINQVLRFPEEDKVTCLKKFQELSTHWFLDGVITEIRDFTSTIRNKSERFSKPPKTQIETNEFVEIFLSMLKELGIYPVFLIDEFESIISLNNGSSGKDRALSVFREFDDKLNSKEGTGALIILSTNDSYNVISRYPALADRFKSSEYHSLPNKKWDIGILSNWNGKFVLEKIKKMYESASNYDYVAKKVYEKIHSLDKDIERYIIEVLENEEATARTKLQEVIQNIFDPISSESSADMVISDIKQTVKNWKVEKEKEEVSKLVTRTFSPTNKNELAEEDLLFSDKLNSEECYEAKIAEQKVHNEKDGFSIIQGINELNDFKFDCLELEQYRYSDKNHDSIDESLKDDIFYVNGYTQNINGENMMFLVPKNELKTKQNLETFILKSLKNKNKGLMYIGHFIATWRMYKSTVISENLKSYVYENIQEKFGKFNLEDRKKHTEDMLTAIFNLVHNTQKLYPSMPISKRDKIQYISPCYDIVSMRNFTYQYYLQNGYLPADNEIDQFVIENLQNIFNIQTRLSRKGVHFNVECANDKPYSLTSFLKRKRMIANIKIN